MRAMNIAIGILLCGLACAGAAARDLYASPNGRPGAAATREAPLDIYSVLSGAADVRPGDTVWLLEGVYPAPEQDGKRIEFTSRLTGEADKPIILRAEPGKRVTLDGWMEINGANTWYWGFEVADSRYTDKTEEGLRLAGTGTGVNVRAPGAKFINLDVHDGAMGFGFWTPAVDAEIYGCIIHDFGYAGDQRGHGHAIYTQNNIGTKRIVDNIMFNGFGWNLHVYTQGGQTQGFHIEGNIAFSPGMRVDDPPKDNYLIMSYPAQDRIEFINNVAYHPERGGWRPNVRLSTYRDKNLGGTVRDNYIMGLRGLDVSRWGKMEVTGNTVWGPDLALTVRRDPEDNWVVNNNTYIAPAGAQFFNGATFEEYRRATGFDADSILIEAERPTQNHIFIRPNQYEPGRANIAVFNWEGLDKVAVDLAGVLPQGARYVIHNVQGLYGEPVAEGEFDGAPVELPMLRSKIAPDFDAFLLRTVEAK